MCCVCVCVIYGCSGGAQAVREERKEMNSFPGVLWSLFHLQTVLFFFTARAAAVESVDFNSLTF